MILFGIIINALAIASMFFPDGPVWYSQLLLRFIVLLIYMVYIHKSRDTSPERAFLAQRYILLASACVSVYILFSPVFRRLPNPDFEYRCLASAIIAGALIKRWDYTDHD